MRFISWEGECMSGCDEQCKSFITYSNEAVKGKHPKMFVVALTVMLIAFAPFGESTSYNYAVNSAILVGKALKDTEGTVLKALSAANGGFVLGGFSTGSIGGQTNAGTGSTYDFVVQRYDSSKNLVWTKMFGTTRNDKLYDLAVDVNDNIYAVGACTNSDDDLCMVSYDVSGTLRWSVVTAGTGNGNMADTGRGICIDPAGTYFYAVGDTSSGYFQGTTAAQSRTGSLASWWAKYRTSDGGLVMSLDIGNFGVVYNYGCAVDSDGNVVVAGTINYSGSTVNYYAGTTLAAPVANSGYDFLYSKVSPTGTVLTSARLGGTSNDIMYAVAVDTSKNIYATGYSAYASGTLYGNPYLGSQDIVVQKLDTSLALQWTKVLGGSMNDNGYAIAVDSVNNLVYITGYTKSNDYVTGATTANLGTTFLSILDSTNGNELYSTALKSSASDTGNSIILKDGLLYIVGQTNGAYGSTAVTGAPDLSFLVLGPAGTPTASPTAAPSAPTTAPTVGPTAAPIISGYPTTEPTLAPSDYPTLTPSAMPTTEPTATPSAVPTAVPSVVPSFSPSAVPSFVPTAVPTAIPTLAPSSGSKNLDLSPADDKGPIAGIVIGSFIAFLILICIVYYVCYYVPYVLGAAIRRRDAVPADDNDVDHNAKENEREAEMVIAVDRDSSV